LWRTDLVISDCHNSAQIARELGLVRRDLAVVWDCVDLDRFRPGAVNPRVLARYGLGQSARFRLMFLARLSRFSRYKGSERVLALLARLPAERFELAVAGRGDDVAHLDALASRLGVRLQGLLPGQRGGAMEGRGHPVDATRLAISR
jgi:glycosyltransferase involved in cell wall biosynthesis